MSFTPIPRRPALPFFLGATLLALVVGCTQSGTSAPPAARPPMAVTVLEMTPATVPTSVEVVAQTEGARETEVRARVGGLLLQQLFQEGEAVTAGQPLFQIERTTYEIAVADAQARAEMAAREVQRLEGLVAQKVVSRRDYDNAVSAATIAQAALRQARLNLSWTTVTAPLSGITGRALLSQGALITSGADTLLTSIYQLNPIWLRFSVAPGDLAALPGGVLDPSAVSGVELVLPDGSLYPQRGHLNFVASTIDPRLGTRQLRAEFPNEEQRLLPGQFVRARLLLGEREGVFLVPQAAVLQSDKGRSVMVLGEENKVTPRPVESAEWRGKEWVITAGLKAGDRVIIDNLIKLRPGMVVTPKPQGEQPAPAVGKP
jgi:membrane fusion protein (multidrug efflux system)